MSTLTIHNLEPAVKDKLLIAAAAHGHSVEEEVRAILHNALMRPAPVFGLGSHIHQRFAALGGVELNIPARTDMP